MTHMRSYPKYKVWQRLNPYTFPTDNGSNEVASYGPSSIDSYRSSNLEFPDVLTIEHAVAQHE